MPLVMFLTEYIEAVEDAQETNKKISKNKTSYKASNLKRARHRR